MPDIFDQVAEKGDIFDEVASQPAGNLPPKPEKSLGGFASNLARSGVKFVSDTASGLKAMHDATPLSTRLETAAGAMLPPVAAYRSIRGWVDGSTPDTIKSVVGGMADRLGQRYGSPRKALDTLYEDPVGSLSDISAVAGGGGALLKGGALAAKAAQLPRVAKVAGAVAKVANDASLATNPLTIPTRTLPAIPGVQSAINKIAEGQYGRTLKPSTTMAPGEREAIVRMGLEEGIPLSRKGLDKISELTGEIDKLVAGKIAQGAKSGLTADPSSVVAETSRSRAAFRNQVNPRSDMEAIDRASQEFLASHAGATPTKPLGDPIPLDRAQAIKSGTYRKLRGSYGEQGMATKEAQKDLARGLKNEIYSHFPELQKLGAKERVLIQLEEQLERFVGREGNKLPVSLNTPLTAAAGGGGLAILQHVIDRAPGITSRIAAALYKASGEPVKPANIRQIINAASAAGRDTDQNQ